MDFLQSSIEPAKTELIGQQNMRPLLMGFHKLKLIIGWGKKIMILVALV